MAALRYSFSQIEAFAAVAQFGTVSRAAVALNKDRTTVRDLLDYLEDALGYRVFDHQGGSLRLSQQGEQLYRQAQLFIRQAHAFESFAGSLAGARQKAIALVYDPFVPRAFLDAVIAELTAQQIRVNCWSASRDEAEEALRSQRADLAICQAINRTLGSEMEWCALGTIELAFYAAKSLFAGKALPLSLLDLSLQPQLVMHHRADEQISRRLQIAGQTLFVNQCSDLRILMEQGQGWGFIPGGFHAEQWDNVCALPTEVGNQGLSIPLVTLWSPGASKHRLIDETLKKLPVLWQKAHINGG